uniref:Uncharacterized protein n=1 Tax=Romanomermis culicivorax TaxID=13658 RepID=A0A915IMK5_ROMCU
MLISGLENRCDFIITGIIIDPEILQRGYLKLSLPLDKRQVLKKAEKDDRTANEIKIRSSCFIELLTILE